jgi:hypothetical protein
MGYCDKDVLNIESGVAHLPLSLLQNGQGESLILGQSDERLLASTNDEDIGLPGSEGLSISILNVDNIVASNVPLNVGDLSHSADVVASSREAGVTGIVLDPLNNFVVHEIVLESVAFLNFGVREPNCPGIVGHDVGDHVGADTLALDLEQLELSLQMGIRWPHCLR